MRDGEDLVRRAARVRVRSGALGYEDHVMAEGKVLAYCDRPMILVQADNGARNWWPITLPIDELSGDA